MGSCTLKPLGFSFTPIALRNVDLWMGTILSPMILVSRTPFLILIMVKAVCKRLSGSGGGSGILVKGMDMG